MRLPLPPKGQTVTDQTMTTTTNPTTDKPTEAEVAEAITDSGWSEGMDEFGKFGPFFDPIQAARAVLALFADRPTEQAVRADEALLIAGHVDRGRGFDGVLRRGLEDTEVRAGYVAGQLRRIKAEALREAADAEEARCTGDWNGTVCDNCRASANRLRKRAARIESEG